VEALYDRKAGRAATLRNLLQREGYADLESVLEQGKQEGREQGKQEGREQGKREGREQGKQEGREQGKQEGRQVAEALFLLLLEKSFESVPPAIRQRISEASLTQIEQWSRNTLTASSLDEVFV
jgi:flagellar biosynthesis/type III secretory pathway protein FliH